jgi:cytoskeletal protein CcmA (bactofilin family)
MSIVKIINDLKSFISNFNSGNNSEQNSKILNSLAFKSMPSILSKDFELTGEINSSGVLEIEGKVKGIIRGNSVVIREEGWVDGRIEVDSINIRGKFSGEIKARNINIFKKAQITGKIEYISLSVEDGACIEGQFKQSTDKNLLHKVTALNN